MVRWLSCLVVLVCAGSLPAQEALPRPPSLDSDTLPPPRVVRASGLPNIGNGNPIGLIIAAVVTPTLPFVLPGDLLGDSIRQLGYFPARPYAPEYAHFIQRGEVPGNNDDLDVLDPARFKPWSVRLALEDGNDFNHLNRLGGRFALDTAWRIGLTTNWNYFTQRLPGGSSNESLVGDFNLTFRIAQAHWAQVHFGVGARLLTDRYTTQGGFNLLYSADFFPIEPLVISTQIDLGNLSDSFVIHARGTVGCQVGRFELFGGYDFLRIGSVNLQGPLAGLRLWF